MDIDWCLPSFDWLLWNNCLREQPFLFHSNIFQKSNFLLFEGIDFVYGMQYNPNIIIAR